MLLVNVAASSPLTSSCTMHVFHSHGATVARYAAAVMSEIVHRALSTLQTSREIDDAALVVALAPLTEIYPQVRCPCMACVCMPSC